MKRGALLIAIIPLLLVIGCSDKVKGKAAMKIPAPTAEPYVDSKTYDYTPIDRSSELVLKKRIAVARFEDNLPAEDSPFGKYKKMPDGSLQILRKKTEQGATEKEALRIEPGHAVLLEGQKGVVNPRFHEMVINELHKTKRFIVIERQDVNAILRELQFGDSKWVDSERAAKAGKMLGAQLIITGTFGMNNEALTFYQAPLSLYMRIYDANSGRIVGSQRVTGTSPFELIRSGVGMLAYNAEQIPWAAAVANVRGDFLYINEGLSSNLQVGDTLLIYSLGKKILDPGDRETVLGYQEELAGEGEVVNVEEKLAKVRVTKKERAIKTGDKVKMLARKGETL